jgi:hypothetical protein
MANPNTTEHGCRNTRPQGSSQRTTWLESLLRHAGKAILALCPQGAEPCHKQKCDLQPFCDCARGDFSAAAKLESRLWLALSICGVVLLIIAFDYAMKR